jgi:hypothetical protein
MKSLNFILEPEYLNFSKDEDLYWEVIARLGLYNFYIYKLEVKKNQSEMTS